jgi:hypothetical protein
MSKYLYYADEDKLRKLLNDVCHLFKNWDGKNYAKFDPEWSDERVASVLAIPVPSVQRVRTLMFGKVRIPHPPRIEHPASPPVMPVQAVQVGGVSQLGVQLIQRVARLEEINDQLQKRLTQLEDAVTKPYQLHPTHRSLNDEHAR